MRVLSGIDVAQMTRFRHRPKELVNPEGPAKPCARLDSGRFVRESTRRIDLEPKSKRAQLPQPHPGFAAFRPDSTLAVARFRSPVLPAGAAPAY